MLDAGRLFAKLKMELRRGEPSPEVQAGLNEIVEMGLGAAAGMEGTGSEPLAARNGRVMVPDTI